MSWPPELACLMQKCCVHAVVEGRWWSANFTDGTLLTTLGGGVLQVLLQIDLLLQCLCLYLSANLYVVSALPYLVAVYTAMKCLDRMVCICASYSSKGSEVLPVQYEMHISAGLCMHDGLLSSRIVGGCPVTLSTPAQLSCSLVPKPRSAESLTPLHACTTCPCATSLAPQSVRDRSKASPHG